MTKKIFEPWQAVDNHLNNIVSYLKSLVPSRVNVETYSGRFNSEDLSLYSKKAPVLLVSLIQLQVESANRPISTNVRSSSVPTVGKPQVVMNMKIILTIVCKDMPGNVKRDKVGIYLAQALAMNLPYQTFSSHHVSPVPAHVDVRNLFNVKVDKAIKTAFWVTSFEQKLTVPQPLETQSIPNEWLLSEESILGE